MSEINGSDDTTIDGEFGTLVWQTDGSYEYFLNNNTIAVQSLSVGQEITDSFTYKVEDGNGGVDSSTLVITIIGNNDAPIAVNDFNEISENDTIITHESPASSGNILVNDSDIDQLDILEVETVNNGTGTTVRGEFGVLRWDSDGTYEYELLNSLPEVTSLAQGEVLVDTFDIVISDFNQGRDTSYLIITINGGNQAPEAESDTLCLFEGDALVESPTTLLANDFDGDASDVLNVVSLGEDSTGTVQGDFGQLSWSSAGVYSYEVNNELDTVINLSLIHI